MAKQNLPVLIVLFALFVLFCPVKSTAQDTPPHVVTAANQKLTFIPRPELGYVVKTQQKAFNPKALSGTPQLFLNAEIKPVKGLDRKGFSVIYNDNSADENEKTIATLSNHNQVRYAAPLFSSNGEIVAVIPEIAVSLKPDTELEELRTLCETMGLSIIKKMELTDDEYLLEVPGTDVNYVFDAIEQLNRISFIEWACPNIAFQPMLFDQIIPNDEYFPNQWDLHNTGQTNGTPEADINATLAWEITTGDPNIVIAVLDSGVDVNHPDLINNLVPGYDFCDYDEFPDPCLSDPYDAHGTNCAGLIAAQGNNVIGTTGVTWNCKIMPIRILGENDSFDTDADIADAIRWAADNGADILSNSWGGLFPLILTHSAIVDVTKPGGIGRNGKGCVVLCAAGNWEGGGPVDYPASYPEVIAVGATDHDDEVWHYSASGPELDLVAPSGGIERTDYFLLGKPFQWTTDITGIPGYSIENLDISIMDYTDSMGGTSGACPIAAGVAALVLSIDPNLTNTEVRSILVNSAVDLGEPSWDEYYGHGRVDAFAAVNLALNWQSPEEPPVNPPVQGSTLYIDDDAINDPGPADADISDPNEDGSIEHPFDTIQEAIDKAIDSDSIIVLDGTYSGNGNRDIDFKGKAITIRSENGPENCIIDCQNSGRGFYFHLSEGAASVLDGLTITNGNADEGGGIYCDSNCNPTISNCVLKNNTANSSGWLGGDGGGMYNLNNRPTIINCTFTGNQADYGAGMYNYDSSPMLSNCTFTENVTVWDGAGIYNDWSYVELTDCTIALNSAGDWGGGIRSSGGTLTLTNCIISDNAADSYGGGIYNDWSSLTVTNSIFSLNTVEYDGGAIYNEWSELTMINCTCYGNVAGSNGSALAFDSYLFSEPSIAEITNCIIRGNQHQVWNNDDSTITITFSNIEVDTRVPWPGQGNVDKNPFFADQLNGDYHLKSQAGRWDSNSQSWVIDDVTSSCIDAGNPETSVGLEPLPNGGVINMGAYGGTEQASKSPEN